tara:strand:+ start:550 stop:1074 length:525 start_codon:yes stop_codon:yes gene_type:complete
MNMSDSIYNTHKPASDGVILKLKDGDKVKMRIFSKPAIVVYEKGQRPRYAWVVINHDAEKAQVYGAGISVYSQIANLVEDWGEPTEFDIRISRSGSGQFDTEYNVTPVKNSTAPSKELEAEAEKIDLLAVSKGKWLEDYEKDQKLPDPVKESEAKDEVVPTDEDEPIDLSKIPF